jgi:hypothetical protein
MVLGMDSDDVRGALSGSRVDLQKGNLSVSNEKIAE